jgi:hypothetical protein
LEEGDGGGEISLERDARAKWERERRTLYDSSDGL